MIQTDRFTNPSPWRLDLDASDMETSVTIAAWLFNQSEASIQLKVELFQQSIRSANQRLKICSGTHSKLFKIKTLIKS